MCVVYVCVPLPRSPLPVLTVLRICNHRSLGISNSRNLSKTVTRAPCAIAFNAPPCVCITRVTNQEKDAGGARHCVLRFECPVVWFWGQLLNVRGEGRSYIHVRGVRMNEGSITSNSPSDRTVLNILIHHIGSILKATNAASTAGRESLAIALIAPSCVCVWKSPTKIGSEVQFVD